MTDAHDASPIRLAVVLGSTRPGRRSYGVGTWVLDIARRRPGLEPELVDISEYALPVLDEPLPAVYGQYEHAHTSAWAETIASFDAFVFVTPEYNRSITGALKNAIYFLYAEWHNKVAGFVSYGIDAGGARAVEQLRLVMGELQVADVRAQVVLSVREEFDGTDGFTPQARREQELARLLDQVEAWGRALRGVRGSMAVA